MCNDCAICMEPLFNKKDPKLMRLKKKVLVKRGEKLPVVKLKCGHTFHTKCIKDWFVKTEIEASNKCPMCRGNIRFKPDSKDLMMNKIRWNDKDYEYGDEFVYELETDSNYSSDYDDDYDSDGEEESIERARDFQYNWTTFEVGDDYELEEGEIIEDDIVESVARELEQMYRELVHYDNEIL